MTFYVHGFMDDKPVIRRRMNEIPNKGDTIRFEGEVYGIVKEVVWCMDEDCPVGQRVNIRIEREKDR